MVIPCLGPGYPEPALQLASHLQGYGRGREGGSLSPNNVRIKDRRHRAGHSPHPQLFFSPPYFPPLHSGSPHLFFHPPHRAAVAGRGGGWGGLPNPTLERSGQNYLSWHQPDHGFHLFQIRHGLESLQRKSQSALPFSLFLKEEAPRLHPDTPSQTP